MSKAKINLDKLFIKVLSGQFNYFLESNYLIEITFDEELFHIYTDATNFFTRLGEVVKVSDKEYKINYRSKVLNLVRGRQDSDIRIQVLTKQYPDIKDRLKTYLSRSEFIV
jgi:hypothetical protein